MKINLAILEKDTGYMNKLVSVFNRKYADKIQVYSFTEPEAAYATLRTTKVDVMVASDLFDIDMSRIPPRCGFAYFADTDDIDSINGRRAICKFQKVDLIYKQILSVYSDHAKNVLSVKLADSACRLIAFCSPSGGSGSSSVSVAAAMRYASAGHRTRYLDLEKFGSADNYFSAEGQFDFSDIIYALKSNKANLGMKLESCVKQDSCGVNYYSASKQSPDMLELRCEEIGRLLEELQLMGSYDYIFADMDFEMTDAFLNLLKRFHAVVVAGTGSSSSNYKICRMYDALRIKENETKSSVLDRMCLLYNKFSSKTSRLLNGVDIRNIGGIPNCENATDERIAAQISGMAVLDHILPE